MPSTNTAQKQTFARGLANTLPYPARKPDRLSRAGLTRAALRSDTIATPSAIAPSAVMTKNTPRQPTRSPTTPASEEPSRLPVMTAVSQRPIAT